MDFTIFNRPNDDYLEGNVVWRVQTDKGNEYWGKESWARGINNLINCVKSRNESIIAMDIRFRSHVICLPPNKDGYYFSLGILGNPSQGTREMYTIGYIEGDIVRCTKLIVPELFVWSNEDRDFESCKNGLIRHINQSTVPQNQLQAQPT
jgi:hypothetical protein